MAVAFKTYGARRAILIGVSVMVLANSGSRAGTAVVSASTGPPELLVLGHLPISPMDRNDYAREIERLASRGDLVPVREWPDELPADAPEFLTELVGPIVTLAIRGDASSGFELLADGDADGKLDEPGIPFKKSGDEWIATFRVAPLAARSEEGRRAPLLVEARWEQVSFQEHGEKSWRLLICRTNVRRGVIDLAGRKTAFAITGEAGAYGQGSLEVFFDLDGDGRLALDSRYSSERFTVSEDHVVVGHTAYQFMVDPAGDAITLTRLPGRFEPRKNLDVLARAPDFNLTDIEGRARRLSDVRGRVVLLDFWSIGCGPCVWELPDLAALRNKYRERGFDILGIHVGPLVPEIATTCASKGADWPQLVDGTHGVADLYRVSRYPTTFLLDRKGRIIVQDARGEALEAAVQKALSR
jgi:thiol-disulfide isomerase/thioredoxin